MIYVYEKMTNGKYSERGHVTENGKYFGCIFTIDGKTNLRNVFEGKTDPTINYPNLFTNENKIDFSDVTIAVTEKEHNLIVTKIRDLTIEEQAEKSAKELETKKEAIRNERAPLMKFFDKSQLWYADRTDEELSAIYSYREALKNVTNTFSMPEMPEILKKYADRI